MQSILDISFFSNGFVLSAGFKIFTRSRRYRKKIKASRIKLNFKEIKKGNKIAFNLTNDYQSFLKGAIAIAKKANKKNFK